MSVVSEPSRRRDTLSNQGANLRLETSRRHEDWPDDIEAAERAAIMADPELAPPGTPERQLLDDKQAETVSGLLSGFANRASPARALPLVISFFDRAILENGPALGEQRSVRWAEFTALLLRRRQGDKDGPNFVPARFTLEPDGQHVRRLKRNLAARAAVALDCETNKKTGEVPPSVAAAVQRVQRTGWAAAVYTSHSHAGTAPRYRIVLPLSEEIDHNLPAPEVVADELGLAGVLDTSKINAASLFYLPSAAPGELHRHQTEVIAGAPIDAAWIGEVGGALLAARGAEQERLAELAHTEAAARREAKIAAGFNPDDSLIEKLRSHFDLAEVLLSHSYDRNGTKYRHSNSSSGSYGADIKVFGGIERVFSHNGTDPLHADNLPEWCGGVTALDVVDVVTILDFSGDRRKALADLAQRFGLNKTEERKAVAKLLFRLIREQATQEEIETAAMGEGARLGLSSAEIYQVARWVADSAVQQEAA